MLGQRDVSTQSPLMEAAIVFRSCRSGVKECRSSQLASFSASNANSSMCSALHGSFRPHKSLGSSCLADIHNPSWQHLPNFVNRLVAARNVGLGMSTDKHRRGLSYSLQRWHSHPFLTVFAARKTRLSLLQLSHKAAAAMALDRVLGS